MMISIAMATYNGEKYIVEQLTSLVNQSVKFDELVIVDDGSSDQTVAKIQEFIDNHADFNIKLVVNEHNLGYRLNFKKALSMVRGDYIFLADQDDVWMDDKLASMLQQFKKLGSHGVMACSFTPVNENLQPVTVKLNKHKANNNLVDQPVEEEAVVIMDKLSVLHKNYAQGCCMLVSKTVVDQYLKLTDYPLPHDWQLALIAASEDCCYFYNKPLIKYRLHSGNAIGLAAVLEDQKQQSRQSRLQNRAKILQDECQSADLMLAVNPQPLVQNFQKYMHFRIACINNRQLIKLLLQVWPKYHQFANLNSIGGDVLAIIKSYLHK